MRELSSCPFLIVVVAGDQRKTVIHFARNLQAIANGLSNAGLRATPAALDESASHQLEAIAVSYDDFASQICVRSTATTFSGSH